jgi:8-amino-7-oxononanoate synthase
VDGGQLVNFGSNDYLGLAADPAVAQAAAQVLADAGCGAGASPLVTGYHRLHQQLEARLAELKGAAAALLFPTGFAANLGTIPALVGAGDAVLSDERNHASIVDGCRLARAEVVIYRHRDFSEVEHHLRARSAARRRLIVTDSVFSMDGDLAPLGDLVELAERHEAMLLIDEAHATGVFGPSGRGLAAAAGVESRVTVQVGTLSKALGGGGGFVCGSEALIAWLANRSRPYVFSTALPPVLAAAALAALDQLAIDPTRGRKVLDRAAGLRRRLVERGWNVLDSQSQIIPLVVGDPGATMRLSARLRAEGFWVPGMRPPTVPAGQSLLRVSVCHGHTAEMIDQLVEALGPPPAGAPRPAG